MNFLDGTLHDGRVEVGSHQIALPDSICVNGHGPESITARVEISERLGRQVLVYLRADTVTVATVGERTVRPEDEAPELQDTLAARFDPGFAGAPGLSVALTIKRDAVQTVRPGIRPLAAGGLSRSRVRDAGPTVALFDAERGAGIGQRRACRVSVRTRRIDQQTDLHSQTV